MAKALIVFGSETGNTREATSIIADELGGKGLDVEVRNVADVEITILAAPSDVYLLGVSTWGAVEDEVTEDFKDFFAAMAEADLSGKSMVVFGCGDSGYEQFCKAVDHVEERAREKGATILHDSLKIDLDPSESEDAIRAWARDLADKLY